MLAILPLSCNLHIVTFTGIICCCCCCNYLPEHVDLGLLCFVGERRHADETVKKCSVRLPAGQEAGFPGMAVTVLLGLHESDVAGTAVLYCPEWVVLTGGTGSPAAGAEEPSKHSSGRNANSISHSSGRGWIWFSTIGYEKKKKKKPPARGTSYHRTLTAVSLSQCGRTVLLSSAVLQVQTFCCSWWQSLIMCSTKQELGLYRRMAV